MIQVICHRGWWEEISEQNTLVAFQRALDNGLGFELDVRDDRGRLIVSHDPTDHPTLWFDGILRLMEGREEAILVNVKSCGLVPLFSRIKRLKNLIFFDVPEEEEIEYREMGFSVHWRSFCRHHIINAHNDEYCDVFISPEVYGHWGLIDRENLWRFADSWAGGYLVTDIPKIAKEFFK